MDVFSALQTAVSGMKAQGFSLENISGNIANSQTTGFKRVDTSFVDLVAEQAPSRQVSGSVRANSVLTNSIQGNIIATETPTNIALNGPGFFAVQTKTSDVNGQTSFSPENLYTRRGDFKPDDEGYLRNGGGAYLTGTNLNPITGNATSQGPIQISKLPIPGKATSAINYAAELPQAPSKDLVGTGLAGNPNPIVLTGVGGGTVASGVEAKKLMDGSMAGPMLTTYSAIGAPVDLKTVWTKIQDAAAATTITNDDGTTTAVPAKNAVWNLFYANDTTVSGADSSWKNAGTAFEFDAGGTLLKPDGGSITLAAPTIDGVALGPITINYGQGLTAFGKGEVVTSKLNQDGFTSGSYKDSYISEDGDVVANYSNGNSVTIAKVKVVQFTNPDGLKADSSGNYRQTLDSGNPLVGLNGTTIEGQNIEQSNTDIASEFSKMIVTQQAYSANTKVISTAQDMMSSLINIIR
ncbi:MULTISPECIES: flagellar hook-basal body complex protein [Methylobacterium]|uniref:Flagellar hook protein FlgE n=1 Tax=Methylobacterium bullatum TaxID=570505 RepID=A0AAV4Z801_9HYPH|nr:MULTISPECIES: flagellar hook-basal body complex protein [Methylobacterium]MBD8902127.1 flagellar biosynthesis protein FlgE [Methylobacterium bullatum]TXN33435.1 flagellar hook-basal body complex protein [Methylobacterium sp. WL19]GJD40264.1 Flagellar hook protein FlgE [Methylobacterium bullatum]